MFQKHAPLSISLDGSLHQLKWMAQMLVNCSPERYDINKERMLRLAEYSRDCLRTLRTETGIQYEQRTGGTLQLFRTRKQFEAARQDIRVLERCNVPYELLEEHQLASAEPALANVKGKLTGGLRLPNDETGDCNLFTKRLAEAAESLASPSVSVRTSLPSIRATDASPAFASATSASRRTLTFWRAAVTRAIWRCRSASTCRCIR